MHINFQRQSPVPLLAWTRTAILLVPLLLILALWATPARADSGRDSEATTGWFVYTGQTAADVSNTVSLGYRPVSLKVVGAGPIFDVTYVANSGAYAQSWWWYYGVTIADVSAALTANNARLISVESYDAGGGARRFAVIMVSNTGANAKTWYWYAANSIANISASATANNTRVVYLSSDTIGGTRVYNAILISNTGADNNSWSWWTGASISFISGRVNTNHERILSLEVVDPAGPTFNVALEGSRGQRWWWFVGLGSPTAALSQATQYGARIFDIERYTVGASTYFAILLMDDSNALTERIGDILRAGTDGVSGCYLKQVNGPVLAGLQQDLVFEPASAMKALYHMHSLLRMQAGSIGLGTNHNVYASYSGSCPLDASPFSENFQTTLNLMMVNSDNARAQSVRAYFGQTALNTTAAALGMSNSLVQHRMGCGDDPAGDFGTITHPNHTTLTDLGRIYELAATGTLNSTYKPLFYSLMDHSLHADVDAIITAEASSLGVSASALATFRANVSECYKGGNYNLSTGGPFWYDQSRMGWIKIPHRTPGCTTTSYEYVYGTYVNNASNLTNASNAAETAFAELTREQIRAGLATYSCPADFNASGTLEVQDIFDFLNAWFAALPCANFSGGTLSVQDIFDFLNAWFAGC